MPVQIVIGDALNTKAEYICHQVNYYGVMGAGIAKQIRLKYPENFYSYKKLCDITHNKSDLLGTVHMCSENGKTILNMFSLDGMGYDGCFTDYDSFAKCLNVIRDTVPFCSTIAMPYLIGCGIAGGDWNIIYNLIKDILGLTHEVILYDIDGLSKK